MIDYKAIVENLKVDKIKELLEKLGAEQVIEKDGYLLTNTICHNISGGSLKLYYYKDSHMFYCYTNCESLSIFNFLKEYYKTRQIEYNWYEDIYEVVKSCCDGNINIQGARDDNFIGLRERYEKQNKNIDLPIYNKGVLNIFSKYYPPEWLGDGITKEAMDKFNISYSISQNKIIIPHYNINNELVGIRGRALNPEEIEYVGKYAPVQIEGRWYSHRLSLNLYGLNFNLDNIKQTGIVYIVESEKAVMQAENFSQPNCCVAVCGSSLNKFQLHLLLKYAQPREVVIAFDNEELPNEDKYFNKLYNMCQKYNQYTDFSFLYDFDGLLNLKDSPTDKGEKTFIQLIRKRVKVK